MSFLLVPMALPSFPGADGLPSGAVGAVLAATFGLLAIFLVGAVRVGHVGG